jgi:hypothetical protein
MLDKIKKITENPLEAARISEELAIADDQLNITMTFKERKQKLLESQYETNILETTLIKIGALLALGFGEAGSEIIAKNMKVGGSVDPMLPGKKILAIYGFCAIRYFAEATEVLENKIMLFANEIAEIVHSVNDSFYGAINKNLGDCFLIIWKLNKRHNMILLND